MHARAASSARTTPFLCLVPRTSVFTPHMLCTCLLQITVRFALPDDEVTEEDVEQLRKDGASEAQVRRIALKLLVDQAGQAGRAGSAGHAGDFGKAEWTWPREWAGPLRPRPRLPACCFSVAAFARAAGHAPPPLSATPPTRAVLRTPPFHHLRRFSRSGSRALGAAWWTFWPTPTSAVAWRVGCWALLLVLPPALASSMRTPHWQSALNEDSMHANFAFNA